MGNYPIKMLVAKPGLDGHDRGAKIISLALRDAGVEVVYTGLHQTVDTIVRTAIQESVDIVGLSIMSGAHIPICRKLFQSMKAKGIPDVSVVVGGVIPAVDVAGLLQMGVKGVFPGGTPLSRIVEGVKAIA